MTTHRTDTPGDQPGPPAEEQPGGSVTEPSEASAATTAPPSAAPHRPRRKVLLLVGIAVLVLAVDIVTKVIAVATLTPGQSPRILGGLVYFSLFRNSGAAFSMATGMTWILAVIALAVVAFIIRMAPRMRSTPWAVCLGLILGGALGNLTDRIFRAPGVMRGHVVDFISVFGPDAQYFPVFNAADSAITIGGITLVLISLLGIDFDGRRHRRGSAGDGHPAAPAQDRSPAEPTQDRGAVAPTQDRGPVAPTQDRGPVAPAQDRSLAAPAQDRDAAGSADKRADG
ncbi:MAG TPA: signal peptidase II [Nakamurella sp.]|nr:signal peptidase II [Nakamurella sp.]